MLLSMHFLDIFICEWDRTCHVMTAALVHDGVIMLKIESLSVLYYQTSRIMHGITF